MQEPGKFSRGPTVPLDIKATPKIVLLGLPKSGKSVLAKSIQAQTGMVHLKMNKIVQEFVDVDSCEAAKLRRLIKKEGRGLDDDTLVNLLTKRMMFEDCQTNGFILEDFPRTRNQA